MSVQGVAERLHAAIRHWNGGDGGIRPFTAAMRAGEWSRQRGSHRGADLSRATVQRYLSGETLPPVDFLEAAAGLTGVRLVWLAFGEGEMTDGAAALGPRPAGGPGEPASHEAAWQAEFAFAMEAAWRGMERMYPDPVPPRLQGAVGAVFTAWRDRRMAAPPRSAAGGAAVWEERRQPVEELAEMIGMVFGTGLAPAHELGARFAPDSPSLLAYAHGVAAALIALAAEIPPVSRGVEPPLQDDTGA